MLTPHSLQGDPGTVLASDEISMTHICSFLWKLHNEEDRKNRYMNEHCQDICGLWSDWAGTLLHYSNITDEKKYESKIVKIDAVSFKFLLFIKILRFFDFLKILMNQILSVSV